MKTFHLFALVLCTAAIATPLSWKPAPAQEVLQIAQSNWSTFSSPNGAFSILMPGNPQPVVQQTVNIPEGQVTSNLFGSRAEDSAYIVGYSDLPISAASAADRQVLFDSFLEGFARSINGQVVDQNPIQLNRHEGREFRVQMNAGITAIGRVYLVEQRLYQMVAVIHREQNSSQRIQGFFDSFRLGADSTAQPTR
ncbi:MAG: hypothetical protein F6K32_07325 [Desertifilum sp. SIO1I2]|nr:hypothetical protein [Desertifilum sp. SIO1I2]